MAITIKKVYGLIKRDTHKLFEKKRGPTAKGIYENHHPNKTTIGKMKNMVQTDHHVRLCPLSNNVVLIVTARLQ